MAQDDDCPDCKQWRPFDDEPDPRDATIAAQAEEIARLREALLFYADVSKYPAPLTGGMGALWEDCGGIARAVLGDKP